MTSQETAAEPKLHAAEPKLRTKSRPTFQTEGRGDRCQLQTKSLLTRPSLSFRKAGRATHNFPSLQQLLAPSGLTPDFKRPSPERRNQNREFLPSTGSYLPMAGRPSVRFCFPIQTTPGAGRLPIQSIRTKKTESIQLRFNCHQTHCELQNGRACANPAAQKAPPGEGKQAAREIWLRGAGKALQYSLPAVLHIDAVWDLEKSRQRRPPKT